jgi:hypothetical protein
MHPQHTVLLADAQRQVQIADHLLTVTYPMVQDAKLLISVTEHLRRAIEDAAGAVVDFHVQRQEYELPMHATDNLSAFTDLVKIRHPHIAAEDDAIKLCHDFRLTLQQHKESHTTFSRDEKLVIAGDQFSFLKEVSPAELKRSLSIVKQFVHGAHQHVVKV